MEDSSRKTIDLLKRETCEKAWWIQFHGGKVLNINWGKVEVLAAELRGMIHQSGYIVGLWDAREYLLSRAMVCPECVGRDDPECTTCEGQGGIIYAPIKLQGE